MKRILTCSVLFLIIILAISVNTSQATMPFFEKLAPVTAHLNAPTAVALDSQENLYVTESSNNRLLIFSQSGQYQKELLGLDRPISVAVDKNGKIYIGNSDTGNVEVYNAELNLLYKLGSGDGEFTKPGALAIDKEGNIYVADSEADRINIYNPDGTNKSSFGSSGSGNGQFTFPTSITIDETSQEVIISDLQIIQTQYGPIRGARVQIFDLAGGFKRSFGEFGQGDGKLTKPMGVAVDKESRIYVTDAYQNVVQVFDAGGVFLGTIYNIADPMRTPLGLSLGKSSRLFIASLNKARVEIYGIGLYIQMSVSPQSFTFEGKQYGETPLLQELQIKNNGNTALNWKAEADSAWITLSQSAGTTEASTITTVNIGINLEGISPGTHTGKINIAAESGATEEVEINLTITPTPALSVTPLSLQFTSEQGSIPLSQDLTIQDTGGGDLNWAAGADSPWIKIDKITGTVTSGNSETLKISVDISTQKEGTYTGHITITGPEGTIGSPAAIPVTLNIIILKGTINVTTNLQASAFTINGPASYTGSGTGWTAAEAPIGTYTIIYGDVEGYITPASESQTLQAKESITFKGQYQETPKPVVKKNIIVGAGPGSANPATVKVFNSDGTPTGIEFTANNYKYGVNIASGDINCDGYDEIITAPGPGYKNPAEVNIFDRNGNPITGLSITAYKYKYGATVASGDFNGDGNHEVIVGTGGGGSGIPAYVKIFEYDPQQQKLIDRGINLLAYNTKSGVKVAAGDLDGDGKDELITAPGPGYNNTGAIKIWKVDTSRGIGQWRASLIKEFTASYNYRYSVTLTSGDIRGDGNEEIITGAGPAPRATDEIKIYDRDGALFNKFRADITNYYGVNVASGDLDGDGVAEIAAGAGPGKANSAAVKIFDAFGTEKGSFTALSTKYGANVAIGRLTE